MADAILRVAALGGCPCVNEFPSGLVSDASEEGCNMSEKRATPELLDRTMLKRVVGGTGGLGLLIDESGGHDWLEPGPAKGGQGGD